MKRGESRQELRVINPATRQVIAKLPTDRPPSVACKYTRARRAQPEWAAVSLSERLSVIARFRHLVESKLEELAQLLTGEVGKPIRQSRNELNAFLGRIDFFIKQTAQTIQPETVWPEKGSGRKSSNLTERITHEPLGVIACISAWNYPWFVGGNVYLPALLAGNTVLYKPSEYATLSGMKMAELLHRAGVPQEVFIVLVGAGEVGVALIAQPIDGVFFTGSDATGQAIACALAGRFVKVQLELGGKDPVYICEDTDIAKSAASVADGAFYNTGQSCCSVERIYVHRRIHKHFVEAFVEQVRSYRIGDPSDEATYIGPLTREEQLDVLEDQVKDAKRRGATIKLGGHRMQGNYFAPTVLTSVSHVMKVMREESFGPIVGIMPVRNDDEAVKQMNDTEYGLTAGVYTPDRQRAENILRPVRSGSAYWNCCDRVSPRLPWGGVDHSGIGVTLSQYGIQTFTRPRAWHLKNGL